MNDMTASIGLVQLKKLPEMLKRREQIASKYSLSFGKIPGLTIPPSKRNSDTLTHYMYWIQLDKRDELANYLMKNNIYTTYRYWPLHRVSKFQYKGKELIGADKATNITLNIPCHHNLSDSEVDYIISTITDFAKKNLK